MVLGLRELPLPKLQAIITRSQAYQAGQPCPLLDQGQCSVYALRPFHCRAMGYCTIQAGETRLPMTCAPEQQRIQRALQGPFPSPAFMFLPQAEALSAHVQAMEPEIAALTDWLNTSSLV
jgi:Fe-S-cluster containining protein